MEYRRGDGRCGGYACGVAVKMTAPHDRDARLDRHKAYGLAVRMTAPHDRDARLDGTGRLQTAIPWATL